MTDDIYEIDTDFSLDNSPQRRKSNTWNTRAVATIFSGVLGILVIISAYALNISNSSYKNASLDSRTLAKPNPSPYPRTEFKGASVSGNLACRKIQTGFCDPVLLTEDGEVILITDQKETLKLIPTGTELVVYGVTPTPDIFRNLTTSPTPSPKNLKKTASSGYSLVVTAIKNSSVIPTPVYPLITLTPIPTITPSITPTITPTPTISDPPNIKEIVDASPGNDGDTLTVIGYIVNANIGEEACVYLNQCDFSTFVVNEDSGINRDTHYDVTVKASKDEKESDYIQNQKVKFNAQVVIVNGVTTLEKLY